MKKVILCALSCAAFCYAMDRNGAKQPDSVAICILNIEDNIYAGIKGIISSQEKKDLKKKKDEEKKQRIDVQQVGKSVMDKNGRIITLPLSDNRRFGRGSSGPGEGQDLVSKL